MYPRDTRILVIDDMKTMRMVVKKALGSLGFTDLTEAEDGVQGFNALKAAYASGKPIQLVISDWTMPNMTGLELLQTIRATEAIKNLPVIMVTAEADAALVKEAIMAGVDNYITKPFTADTLKQKIETVYKKRQQAQKAA